MSPRQRRIRLSAALREPQHQPLSRANGKPARTQYRDREVFQLYSAEVSDREERSALEDSVGYPAVSQDQLYQSPTAEPRRARPQTSACTKSGRSITAHSA